MFVRKKVKFNGKLYNIGVYSYHNKRIRLKYENKSESHDFTIDLNDAFLDEGKAFLDPFIIENGFINVLRKARIIRDINTIITSYNYVSIPTAKINMGKLREYDKYGVQRYLENKEVQW